MRAIIRIFIFVLSLKIFSANFIEISPTYFLGIKLLLKYLLNIIKYNQQVMMNSILSSSVFDFYSFQFICGTV